MRDEPDVVLLANGNRITCEPASILLAGMMPEFNGDYEKFHCAMEVGKFVKEHGLTGIEENLIKILEKLGTPYEFFVARGLTLSDMERVWADNRFDSFKKNLQKILF